MSQKALQLLLAKLSPSERERVLAVAKDYDIDGHDPAWIALAPAWIALVTLERSQTAFDRALMKLDEAEQHRDEAGKPLPTHQAVAALHHQYADLLALAERINQMNLTTCEVRDKSIQETLAGLREAKGELRSLLTATGAARWRQCVDHAEEKVRSIDAITDTLKLQMAGVGEAFQKRIEAACKQITQARGLAVGRLWSVHQQFIAWLAGSVLISALLSALLASWLITGRAPWSTYADHARQLSHGMMLERAWPQLSVPERQRIEQAANR